MAEAPPPPYEQDEGAALRSVWSEEQVAHAVKSMGPSVVWQDYGELCVRHHLDGRAMGEATLEDLVELGFQKIHARAILALFHNEPQQPVVIHAAVEEEAPPRKVEEKKDPFNHSIHTFSPTPSEAHIEQARRLREEISGTEVFRSDPFAPHFCSDANLHRFLRARGYDYPKAFQMLHETLQWRASYRPQDIRGSELPELGRTGKIFSHPMRDRWGRPMLILNNAKENWKNWDDNIRWLTFQFERARKAMEIDHRTGKTPQTVEKWVVFIHLSDFSMWNNPPWRVTSETIKLFTVRYPEHLGHAVLFDSPPIFGGVYSLCAPFLDEVTKSKVVWVRGECGEGEKHDVLMKTLLGDNWKVLTGAFQPVLHKNTHPGFDFDKFWEGLLAEERLWWSFYRDYAKTRGIPLPDEPQEGLEQRQEEKPQEEKPQEEKPQEEKPQEAKPQEAKPQEAKPQEAKPQEAKPQEAKPQEAKPQEEKPQAEAQKKSGGWFSGWI